MPNQQSDGTGTLQTQYTYEPFGYATQTGSASTSSYKYTGREDDGSGLDYYRARYYHPRLQRFIAEDPLGFSGGDVNLYAYAFQNPVMFSDALGLDATCVFSQATGRMICACNGTVIVDITTYSGYGPGKNDPLYQGEPDKGPIPRGVWDIGEMLPRSPGRKLKNPLPLVPRPGNDIYQTQRDPKSFFMHGPKQQGSQDSSNGCPIVNFPDRQSINNCAGSKTLIVVPN